MREKSVKVTGVGGPPAADDMVARHLQEWLRRCMAMHSPPLTAEAWGRIAGVAPTNITRFLKHGYPVPKTSTLAALAKAIGVPSPDARLSTVMIPFIEVPVIFGTIWRRRGLSEARMQAIETALVPAHHAGTVGLRVNTAHGALVGVLAGDLVVVQPDAPLRSGDLAAWVSEQGEVVVMRCEGDTLRIAAIGPPVLEVPVNDPGVVGAIVQLQRDVGRP